jgi:peptidoglycan/LPS O-acetylase OafA/YrhL
MEESAQRNQPFRLGHNRALDGLRGIAVLAVILFHYRFPFSKNGFMGVDVFFVVSGFLITSLLIQEWMDAGEIKLRFFYLRRFLRLYPALLLMLLIVSPIAEPSYIFSTLGYFTNWMMAFTTQPLSDIIGHTWSLSIEEQYYLLWPLSLVFLLKRLPAKKLLLLVTLLALTSAVWRIIVWNSTGSYTRFYDGTDTHADGLLIGSALGIAAVFGFFPDKQHFKRISPLVILIIILLALWLLFDNNLPADFYPYYGSLGISLITAAIIWQVVIHPSKGFSKLFEFPPLVKIGVISYGLYLWHLPIGYVIDRLTAYHNSLIVVLLKIGFTFLISALSYRYLEKPILRLKSRFQRSNSEPDHQIADVKRQL